MKKSDLARRANRAGDTYLRITQQDNSLLGMACALGFESGYRAARADLRRELAALATHPLCEPGHLYKRVQRWLRPIR